MRYRLILKEDAKRDREYQLCLSVIDQLTPQEKKWVMPNGRFVNTPRILYRQVITVNNEPDRGAAFLDLYPYNDSKTAFLVYAVAPQFQRKGLGTMMVCNAIVWCARNGYTKMMWRCDKDNLASLNNAKKFGFNMREKKSCWVGIRSVKDMLPQAKHILGDMYQESYLREDTHPKTLYHLSDNKNLDGKILKPSIPKLKFDDENGTIKRVCFSTTIDGGLQGLYPIYPGTSLDDSRYKSFNGEYLYVYEPDEENFDYIDTNEILKKRYVPDAEVSKEVWITSPIKVKLVGKIYVYSYDSAKPFKYTWKGKKDKPAIGVKLKWKWVDKLKESYLRESSDFEDVKAIMSSLSKEDLINASTDNKPIDPNHMEDSKDCMFRYIYRVNKQPAGYVELYPLDSDPKNTAIIQYSVSTNFQRQGIGRKLLDIAVKWCIKHNFKAIEYYVKKTNIKSLQAGLKYGFKVFDQNKKWVYMKLNLKSILKESEDFSSKDIKLNLMISKATMFSTTGNYSNVEQDKKDIQDILSTLSWKEKIPVYFAFKFGIGSSDKFYYILRQNNIPVGAILLTFDKEHTIADVFIMIRKDCRGKGFSQPLIKHAVSWCRRNNFEKIRWMTSRNNQASYKSALRYGFKLISDTNSKIVCLELDLKKKTKLREDLGNTPKGYKDINKIMDYCNEWFENNPDKADKVVWKRYIQVRNWIRELKKYRSKFGPITFERKIDELKLNKEKKDKDGYIALDRAILMFFKRWKDTKYNMEDLNRDIMYCLIELRSFRKKFKKQDFSCKM